MATMHAMQGRNVPNGVATDIPARFGQDGKRTDEKTEKHREYQHTKHCVSRKAIYTALTRQRPEPVPAERCADVATTDAEARRRVQSGARHNTPPPPDVRSDRNIL